MNKLTDAEIVKALEKILNYEFEEDKVPTAVCTIDFIRSVYNLINELQNEICYFEDRIDEINTENNEVIDLKDAEIERLNKEVDRLSQCVLYHDGQIVDAIKEFAERLKCRSHRFKTIDKIFVDCIPLDYIDNIVKEMVGETDGQADK